MRLCDERLPGILPGLKLGDSTWSLLVEDLPCCHGTGERLAKSADTTERCTLGVRLKETRRLAHQLARTKAASFGLGPLLACSADLSLFLRRLNEIATTGRGRGLVWRGSAAVDKASGDPANLRPMTPGPSSGQLALLAAWRFNLRPHLVFLDETEPSAVLPTRRAEGAPDLIILGQVDGLWDPYKADSFEAIVGYAYAAMTPLFLEFQANQAPPGRQGASTRVAFGRRLCDLKARNPMAWLSPECLARIGAVTAGIDPAVNAEQKRRQKQALSGMPKLPW